MIGAADGGCAARLFVGLTLPGSPPPLCGSAAFLGAAGLQGRLSYRGDFILLPQKWLYDRGRQAAAAPSAFCRADPAGQPSPALRLRCFWGVRGCKVGYLIGGIFIYPPAKMALCSGAAGGGCAARLFVGLTLPGSPPPLCGSAAFLGAAGLHFCRKKRENQRGSRASSMSRSSSRG